MLEIKKDPRDSNPDELKKNYEKFLKLTRKNISLKKVIEGIKKMKRNDDLVKKED